MRTLTDKEAQLLGRILATIEGTQALAEQIGSVQVTDDSTATFLTLMTPGPVTAAPFPDGPAPGRFPVRHGDQIAGEVIVWLKDGRLAGLEYAWFTDSTPSRMPDPDDVDVEGSQPT
jgi:hypothetical protein